MTTKSKAAEPAAEVKSEIKLVDNTDMPYEAPAPAQEEVVELDSGIKQVNYL